MNIFDVKAKKDCSGPARIAYISRLKVGYDFGTAKCQQQHSFACNLWPQLYCLSGAALWSLHTERDKVARLLGARTGDSPQAFLKSIIARAFK